MIFGLSFGCVHKFCLNPNKDEVVTLYRENFKDTINAIEIIICEKDLHKFKLSNVNRNWLRSLNYVSLHLLDTVHSYHKVYRMIKENHLKINAFICHVNKENNIPSFFIQEFGDRIIIENMENDFSYLCNYKSVCFDISHALFNGNDFFSSFVCINDKKIKQVHLSNCIDAKCHQLFNQDLDCFYFVNETLDLKNQVVIVENACENLEELKKEVQFLKGKLNEL